VSTSLALQGAAHVLTRASPRTPRAVANTWIDASIWVQGDLDEQERRLVGRDGDSVAQRQHVAAWLAEELPLMLREQPWTKATVVVAGKTELDVDPDTEIVVVPGVSRRRPCAASG
jgi:hypothetical protein